jgi:DNA polymerase-3 subunit delta
LALYKGVSGEVTLEDAVACVGDSAATSLDQVVFATGGGDPIAVDQALGRVFSEGIAPVAVIRTTLRHFQRLHLVRGLIARDLPLDKAMARLKPPVIFLRAEAFRTQARAWSEARIARALDLLLEAEGDCKTTGMPDQAICSRALLRIAQAAPMYRRK